MGYADHLRSLGYDVKVPMAAKIAEWWGWYRADNDWYSSEEMSAADRRTYKVERISIKPARMVCQEWASLLLNERTVISCEDPDSNAWLEAYLEETRFLDGGQRLIERAFALGTGAWALRVKDLDPNSALSAGAQIIVQRFDARQIIPLSYDEDTCTECAFASQVTSAGKVYDQLQIHQLIDGRYLIETVFFDDKGRRATLPGIAEVFDTGSSAPLFALVRPGLENTYWDYAPFGVSVFDDALGAVKLTDAAVDNMNKDIWLGQKMLFLDERMLETDANGKVRVPRAKDQQLFRKAEMDGVGGLIEEYNPDLRVTDNREALKTALELLGARTGMGSDYFALEGVSGMMTATEVVAEQSDLFRNVRKHENAIAPAIITIIEGVLSLARTLKGAPLPEDPGEITVNFDDSVIEDTDAQRKRDLADIAAGLMQPYEYRVKWYGEDEKTARSMTEGDVLPPAE